MAAGYWGGLGRELGTGEGEAEKNWQRWQSFGVEYTVRVSFREGGECEL